MSPRHLTGLPRVLCGGERLAKHFLSVLGRFVSIVLFAPAIALAAGNIVQYQFDAAGNIIGIQRLPGPLLSITGFTPSSGAVGDAVTISGTGFSATPGSNTVTLNGTAATVSSSTATSISTTVPASATTGRIRVTVSGITATSAADFVVTTAGAPTITSFTPTSGAAGTSIAVTGTNFNTSSTTVKLNGATATSSVSSTTALSFTVPGSTASGRITATTTAGTGTSAADFVVPPPGLALTDIATTIRIGVGNGNSHVTVGTGSKSALVLFDGVVNTYYTLQFASFGTSPTTATVQYKIVKPDNTVWVSGSLSMTTAKTLQLAALPATGTYTLVLSPGNATLDTLVRLEADPVLTLDGSPAALTQDYPYQLSRFVFSATAGQRIGVGALSLAFAPLSAGAMTLQITNVSGTILANQGGCSGPNCDAEFVASSAGTYFVLVNSATNLYTTGAVQISSPANGTLTADTAQSVTLTRVGQDAAYTFTASSGDSYGIDISSISLTPSGGTIAAAVLKPDGTTLASTSATPPAGIFFDLGTLTTAGTYTVTVDPGQGAYGTFKITAKQGPVLQTTDSPTAFATTGTSESARFRFTATAGQNLSVGIASLAYSAGSGLSSLSVYSSSGSSVASANCSPTFPGGDCHAILTNAAAGNYSAVLRAAPGVIMSGSALLSTDLTATLVAGTAQTVTVSRVGQRAKLSFSGTAGDSTSIKAYGVTTSPASTSLSVNIYRPDGGFYNSGSIGSSGTMMLNIASLPATGTYSVIIDSSQGITWSGTVELDPGTLLSIDGSTASLATAAAGEPLRYRFSATAGQRVDFGLSGLTYGAGSGSTGFNLYDPNGNNPVSISCFTTIAGCEFEVATLSATGTYAVVFLPPATTSITAGTLAISTPQAGTFTIGDPGQSISISRPGQSARYTFSGTSAQLLRLNWSSVTVSGGASVSVSVLKPDGSTLTTSNFSNGANGGMDIASLPTTGTYTVVLDPAWAQAMSASIALVTR